MFIHKIIILKLPWERYIVPFLSTKDNLVNQFQPAHIPMAVPFKHDFATGKKKLLPTRQVNIADPMEAHYSFVESRFLRMLNKMGNQNKHTITSIDFYVNPNLEARFKQKEREFQQQYGAHNPDAKPIFGFHGTRSVKIVANIMNKNFCPSKSGKFGAGVYFSEQPAYTFHYGGQNHLIMAQILPGKILECHFSGMGNALCTPGYDSHGGYKQQDGYFKEIVIFNQDQILPYYVIHFR